MSKTVKYGLLVAYTNNVGDDIQSLAAKQFLPTVDIIIDRDNPRNVKCDDIIKVIFNGWLTHSPENYPPAECIIPLFISIHISPKIAHRFFREEVIKYLKTYEPIGARDYATMLLLKRKGIEHYFSGCLTLTLDYKYGYLKSFKKDFIVVADLPQDLLTLLLNIIKRADQKVLVITHQYINSLDIADPIKKFYRIITTREITKQDREEYKYNESHFEFEKALTKALSLKSRINFWLNTYRLRRLNPTYRIRYAEHLIKIYAMAKLVITSRLHVALPAATFGTPVIFVSEKLNDPRFNGLIDLVHHYNLKEFRKQIGKIDYENPPPNPNQEKLNILKRRMIEKILDFIKH